MDTTSTITIASPLLKPVTEAYGIGATYRGMILNLEIGILTPTRGLNLIVAMTAFREKFGFVCPVSGRELRSGPTYAKKARKGLMSGNFQWKISPIG